MSNELANVNKMVDSLQSIESTFYCSLKAETKEDKTKLFNAINNPEYRLKDFINKEINLRDIYCEPVMCVNAETGEPQECPRIVLIDDKGKAYQCVSIGIYSTIKKIIGMFGVPENWEEPLKIRVKQITRGLNSMLTIELV